jgi:hypothetical protein
VKALASEEVGKYLNEHFVSSYQKVANFRIVNGQKLGGNVASYFTLSDGSVLHVLAGPVDAAAFLREARWVVETRKMAILASGGNDTKYKAFWRKAHVQRLCEDHGVVVNFRRKPGYPYMASSLPTAINHMGHPGLGLQGQVHFLLATHPLVRVDKVYKAVFEKILGESISTAPVDDGTVADFSNIPPMAEKLDPTVDWAAEIQPVQERLLVPAEKAEKEERDAARRLRLARILAADAEKEIDRIPTASLREREERFRNAERLLSLAKKHYREIVQEYPKTWVAKEAQRLLGE